ncbi:DUF1648 domain-containing protein [Planococcus maitriensis]|uniref:DUF1648 domain-containing protein n=1 Tax=Planococcus maitriensis TaxID=221799 RepID=A0A365K4J0_9BACL|nr:DUF1648 domain-containing protein [Planococcus maitriensis]RAZ67099.1 hypothetical protein DP119_12450 [Planococcus maitriensis]
MSNIWGRPKIKIPKTKSEWMWDAIGFTFYFGSLIFLIAVYNLLPEEVPVHYNALGEVDRWGMKGELFILPAVAAFIIIFLQLLEKFPQSHNYSERLNETNAKEFYLHSRKLMNQFKNISVIILTSILVESIFVAQGWGNGFGAWFLPLVVLIGLTPIVIGIIKQKKIN